MDDGVVTIEAGRRTAVLAALIDRKLAALTQILSLAQRQLSLVQEGCGMSDLLRLLSSKQSIIEELTRVERALDPFREDDPEQRVWSSPAAREQCARAAERCRACLAETLRLEKQTEVEMSRRRDETARRLESSADALRARQAYRRPASAGPPLATLDLTSSH